MQVILEAEIQYENKIIFQGLFMMRSVLRTIVHELHNNC